MLNVRNRMYTCLDNYFIAGGDSLEVRLETYMWEVLGLNFSRNTGYSECGLPQSLQSNAKIVLQIGHGLFHPSPYQFTIFHLHNPQSEAV
jgi:hypothetical protein